MARIVYLAFPTGGVSGGQKMILRHVETLRDLGFEAVVWQRPDNVTPAWLDHRAPVEVGTPFRSSDVLVVPSDAPNALRGVLSLPQRAVVFCQNQFTMASLGLESLPPEPAPAFMAVGRLALEAIRRLYPQSQAELVPCFADERRFAPGPKSDAVVYAPRKRPLEARAIRNLFRRLHPAHAHLRWIGLDGVHETVVAKAMAGATLFLSLSRLEAVGMTTLEAMASGCVVAGFTGLGGRDFATAENGLWVEEDDCWAAADALAAAAELVRTGGPSLEARIEAGLATARAWSFEVFRQALEDAWTRLAPDARPQSGPLD
jgi:hypothetical protein